MNINIPDTWNKIKLLEILCFFESGSRPKGGVKDYTQGIPSLGGEHLDSSGSFNFKNIKYVPYEFAEKIKRVKIYNGDILIVKDGATTGKISFVDISFPFDFAVINEHLFICRVHSEIESKLIFYYLYSKLGNEQILLDFRGAAQGGISKGFAEKVILPIPPLNEQKRIVSKIESLQQRRDRAKTELEAIKPLLDQFRRSVLSAAFRGDLTRDWRENNPNMEQPKVPLLEKFQLNKTIPDSWVVSNVGSIIESLKYGTSKKCDYDCGGVPVLRIPNINIVDSSISHRDLKYAEFAEEELSKINLQAGDILMIRSNGSVSLVGRTALVRESEQNFTYAGYLIRIRPNKSIIKPQYLNLWFSSFEIRLQIEIPLRSTSGVNNINSDEVKRLYIPMPPLAEQAEIVRRIENLFKLADSIEQQYQLAGDQLENLNQSILAKAFRGELVPQDPNDEPASVLLERIKAEKAKVEQPKRTPKKTTKKESEQLNLFE